MNTEYTPDWISAPGESIQDGLDERGLTHGDLAQALNLSLEDVQLLLAGRLPLDSRIGEALERMSFGTAEFWATRERHYRESLEKRRMQTLMLTAEARRLRRKGLGVIQSIKALREAHPEMTLRDAKEIVSNADDGRNISLRQRQQELGDALADGLLKVAGAQDERDFIVESIRAAIVAGGLPVTAEAVAAFIEALPEALIR